MSKKLFFGSNLKMYKNIKDTVSYLQDLESLTKDISRMKSNYSSFLLILLWIVLRKQSTRKISVWVHRICAGKSRDSSQERFLL